MSLLKALLKRRGCGHRQMLFSQLFFCFGTFTAHTDVFYFLDQQHISHILPKIHLDSFLLTQLQNVVGIDVDAVLCWHENKQKQTFSNLLLKLDVAVLMLVHHKWNKLVMFWLKIAQLSMFSLFSASSWLFIYYRLRPSAHCNLTSGSVQLLFLILFTWSAVYWPNY